MVGFAHGLTAFVLFGLSNGCSEPVSDPDSGGELSDEPDEICLPDCPPSGGSGGSASEAIRPALGAPCETDEECPTGALCLSDSDTGFFGGGIPSGMCVAECSEDASRCEDFQHAVCVDTASEDGGAEAYCFPACAYGVVDADKCGQRTNIACDSLSLGEDAGFCRPFCLSDEDCPGRACDRRLGVCMETSVVDDDFGLPCSPDENETGCTGLCVSLSDDYAVCSHACVFGTIDSCSSAGPTSALCAFAAPGGSIGDLGYCGELCDCNDDCSHPKSVCDPFTEATRELLGRAGVCAPSSGAEGVQGVDCK